MQEWKKETDIEGQICHSRDYIQGSSGNSMQIEKLKFYLTNSCGLSPDKSGTCMF